MAIARLDLDEDQWFEYEDRPTHGAIRRIAKETSRVSRGPDPLQAEDILVSELGKSWAVNDSDGNSLAFTRTSFDKVPQDIWGRLVDACTDVLETNIPNPTARGN